MFILKGSSMSTRSKKRIRQEKLETFVRKVMRPNKRMRVKDIAEAVKRKKYRTKQKNTTYFNASVGVILKNLPEAKKVSRGIFTLRSPRKKRASVKCKK